MNKKLKGLILLVVLAIMGAIMFVVSGQASAVAAFTPYTSTQTWYKAGGTADNIWPQNLTVITCGGISQTDTYSITTAKMDEDFKALLAGKVLNGHKDDAEFSPSDFSVTVLPACTQSVEKPTLAVTPATCSAAGSLAIPANTDKVKWLVGGSQVSGGMGGVLGAGTYSVAAHTTFGYSFPDGTTSVTFSEVVPAQLDTASDACATILPVPATPVLNPATCTEGGSLVVPANDTKVKYLFNNAQVNAGAGGTITTVGDYTLSAHTTFGNIFADGKHSEEFDGSIKAQLSADACAPAVVTPVGDIGTPIAIVPVASNSSLANTGNATLLELILSVGLLLLGGGFVGSSILFSRRKRA